MFGFQKVPFWISLMQVHPALIGRKQVLSNSGIASILVVLITSVTGGTDRCLDSKESTLVTALIGGVIGHYACCNGDTWSSELGILSKAEPRIITTFKVMLRLFFLISQIISKHIILIFHCFLSILSESAEGYEWWCNHRWASRSSSGWILDWACVCADRIIHHSVCFWCILEPAASHTLGYSCWPMWKPDRFVLGRNSPV